MSVMLQALKHWSEPQEPEAWSRMIRFALFMLKAFLPSERVRTKRMITSSQLVSRPPRL
ncbi:MAG: hypothetical protein ACYTGB_20765 [Planctomycetota bacterium]